MKDTSELTESVIDARIELMKVDPRYLEPCNPPKPLKEGYVFDVLVNHGNNTAEHIVCHKKLNNLIEEVKRLEGINAIN